MMSRDQRNLEESLKPFFGWNNGTLLFFNSNYFNSNYEEPVNSLSQPQALLNRPTEFIMLAKHFANKNNMKDNDIHHQYIDFIVNTAQFHRTIDQSTLYSSDMKNIADLTAQAIKNSFNRNVQTIMDFANDHLLDEYGIVLQNDNLSSNTRGDPVTELYYNNLDLTATSSVFEFFVAHLFMLAKQLRKTAPVNPSMQLTNVINLNDINVVSSTNVGVQSLPQSSITRSNIPLFDRQINATTPPSATASYHENNLRHADYINNVRQYINKLFSACTYNGSRVFSHLSMFEGDYIFASLLNDDFGYGRGHAGTPKLFIELNSIINRNNPTTLINNINNIINGAREVFSNCLISLFIQMFTITGIDLDAVNTAFYNYQHSGGQNAYLDEIKGYYTQIMNSFRSSHKEEEIIKYITAGYVDVIKKELNKVMYNKFTLIGDNEWTQKIIEEVFNVWDDLHPIAKQFYMKHLHLFATKVPNRIRGIGIPAPVPTEYVDLMSTGRFKYNHMLATNRNDLRLNLLKGENLEIKFGTTLPWLPVISLGVGHYTASNGSIKQLKLQTDTIRKIYEGIYKNGSVTLDGKVIDFPSSFDEAMRLYGNNDWDVDNMQIVYNKISEQNNNKSLGLANNTSLEFEDLFEDLSTNDFYRRDETGRLYRMVGINKQYIGQPSSDNCAMTYLNNKNNTQCIRVVRDCLISGNKEELSKCLSELSDANLFDVAQSDLKNVHPSMALRILKTFGVNPKIVNGLEYAESENEWINNTVLKLKNADVRNAIIGNNQLRSYISGVIAFVNANPTIMNSHLTDIQPVPVIDDPDPYGKAFFHKPIRGNDKSSLFNGQALSLRNLVNYNNIFVHPVSMSRRDFYTNTLRGYGLGYQIGGANTSKLFEDKLEKANLKGEMGSSLLNGLMDSLIKDLKNAGTPLKKQDIDAITKGINQIKRNEDKLIELYVMMRSLVELSDFFKASCTENVSPREISIRQIRSRQDTVAFLKDSINKMENCIEKNVNSQQSACNEMLKSFASILETAAGQ